ncbi:MAG: Mur ligase domain-containing protein, partial [Microbacterium sp.]
MPAAPNHAGSQLDSRPVERFSSTLDELAGALRGTSAPQVAVTDAPATVVTGISMTTDGVRAGDLFLAVRGERAHGAGYADLARQAGAVAVLTDAEGAALVGHTLPTI